VANAITGLFVTLEGGEGAGKSVQAGALCARLRAAGVNAITTREPGGTPLGERLRAILLGLSNEHAELAPLSEALLFMAARAELVAAVIRPALARGELVICDRFSDSTRAYQGYGKGMDLSVIDELNAIATGGLAPDVVVLLDLPPDVGLSRRPPEGNSDRFGRENIAFHERVRAGYRALAAQDPDRWFVVDASRPRDAIADAICVCIEQELSRRSPA